MPMMAAVAAGQEIHFVDVLGVRVHDVTEAEAAELISGFIEAGGVHAVVTPNPEIVMAAQRDPAYRGILNAADLAIPDGVGLLLAARMAGFRLRAHVRGIDLVLRLAERHARDQRRWFLLGAEPSVADQAGEALTRRFPGLHIAGALAGSPDPADDLTTREQIRRAAPVHVLLVAYGAPRQERWIARNLQALDVPVQMGIGGALNFLAGRSSRAPQWLRRVELEWAYRLMTEPWRWRRQLVLPVFTLRAGAAAVRARLERRQRARRQRGEPPKPGRRVVE